MKSWRIHRQPYITLLLVIFCRIASAVTLCMVASVWAQAAHERGEGDAETGTFLQEAMFARAESLQRCVFSGTESKVLIDADGTETRDTAHFSGAFDFTAGRFRFDYKSENEELTNYHYFESPESRVVYSPATQFQMLRGPVEKYRDRPREFFDVRGIGMVTNSEMKLGLLPDIRGMIEESLVEITGQKQAGSTRMEVVKITANGIGHIRHLLDSEKDYCPVVLEQRTRQRDGEWSGVANSVVVEWQQVNKTWVPESAVLEFFHRNGGKDYRRLDFTWQSVNLEIPSSLFDHKTVELVDGTRILDHVTDPGNPLLVDVVGDPKPIPFPVDDSSGGTRVKWFIAVNVLLVFVLLVVFFVARRRKS